MASIKEMGSASVWISTVPHRTPSSVQSAVKTWRVVSNHILGRYCGFRVSLQAERSLYHIGIDGEIGGSRICPANASSIITIGFRISPNQVDSPSLDPTHKGPIAVYLKKVDSASASNNAAGDGWFKIWESVYDGTRWGTTKMIDNNGHLSVRIPCDIQGGHYLIRTEVLALHQANNNPPNPQFFVGCAQLYIMSNGNAQPSTVSIGEGTYTLNTPGMSYNIYTTPLALPYPMPGPPVYQPGSVNGSGSYPPPQSEGLKPEGCIFVNGNWCGYEVPSYTDQNTCWNVCFSSPFISLP